jgi:hypothetical protein
VYAIYKPVYEIMKFYIKGGNLLHRITYIRMVKVIPLLLIVFVVSGVLQAKEQKIMVFNPLGQPPAIKRVPMAPRVDNLDGKTIYIVDIGFSGTHQFLTELQDILKAKYPKTKWELRTKIGTYFNDDPKLWAEIKEKGHAMIMGVGH